MVQIPIVQLTPWAVSLIFEHNLVLRLNLLDAARRLIIDYGERHSLRSPCGANTLHVVLLAWRIVVDHERELRHVDLGHHLKIADRQCLIIVVGFLESIYARRFADVAVDTVARAVAVRAELSVEVVGSFADNEAGTADVVLDEVCEVSRGGIGLTNVQAVVLDTLEGELLVGHAAGRLFDCW